MKDIGDGPRQLRDVDFGEFRAGIEVESTRAAAVELGKQYHLAWAEGRDPGQELAMALHSAIDTAFDAYVLLAEYSEAPPVKNLNAEQSAKRNLDIAMRAAHREDDGRLP